jgi:hypothetical protein
MGAAQPSTPVGKIGPSWHTELMLKRTVTQNKPAKVKCITIHGVEQARVACQAALKTSMKDNVTLELWSAKNGASSLGPAWFDEIVNIVQKEFPDLVIVGVVDCGDAVGSALAALRHGITCICISERPAVVAKIRSIAKYTRAEVRTKRPAMPDLMEHPEPLELLHTHFS